MSINTAHANNGVLIHAGEAILLFSENVSMEFSGQDDPVFRGTKTGSIYLTTHRMIFLAKKLEDAMKSFSFPFICLTDVEVEQPLFGANYIRGKVRAQENGNFVGEAKFKLLFKSGGAIDFAQAMLRAAHMAKQNAHNAAPPPYTPPSGAWFEAPQPAYTPSPGYYGWLPNAAFPNSPPPNSVFMSDNPPPYPGITPSQPPPSYPQASQYAQQNPGYPGYNAPGQNPYNNAPGQNPYNNAPGQNPYNSVPGYPQHPNSAPAYGYNNVPNYQPQSNVYPQAPQNAYAPPYNPNYAQGAHQQQPPYNPAPGNSMGFAPPPNSKEAEAAQSSNQQPQPFAPQPSGYNEPPPSYSSLNHPVPDKKNQ